MPAGLGGKTGGDGSGRVGLGGKVGGEANRRLVVLVKPWYGLSIKVFLRCRATSLD